MFFLISIVVITGISIKLTVEKSSIDAKKQIKAEITIQNNFISAMNAGKVDDTPEFTPEMVEKIKRIPEMKKSLLKAKHIRQL